ncbi:MAG: MarR family EPS-associated transcriptional regulator [Candidatus Omnitrophica bacterium]|nr:MarR family EPS-associated transcriptional regulator [Candidatus Omnitrophota bacterium]MBU2034339.1 MarR family EPS-associated transcriptional regulator [Candidatus Omnitrophota bacterium]MBU2222090.1 MarR family EPS-associated transcriptional regulator [Candidatus Omnitrophota bacterium]
MNEHIGQEEILFIIKEIENNPSTTQRTLSQKIGISLGKTNYLLKELIKKGFIEASNFSNNPGKLKKINYILTAKGFEHKIELMHLFLKIKEVEYNSLKQDLERITNGA